MANAVQIVGLRQMELAFGRANKAVKEDLRDALMEAAAPVRRDAQSLAASEISNVHQGDPWAGMRIGMGKSIVYVAPIERGVKSRGDERKKRPKFGKKLLEEAMEPALDRNQDGVVKRVQGMLDEVAQVWARG